MSQKVRFTSVTIDAATFTPIPVSYDCQAVELHNTDTTNDCSLYDNADGTGTAWVLQAGNKERLERPLQYGGQWRNRDTVVWAQAASGTGPIRVKHLL